MVLMACLLESPSAQFGQDYPHYACSIQLRQVRYAQEVTSVLE